MESKKLIIGYWNIRGLVRHVEYVLEYCGADYETKLYELGDGPDFSKKVWFDEKFNLGLEFPNLPYVIDGDFTLTETVPVMFYVAEKYKPELNGETAKEKGKVKMLMAILHGLKWDLTMHCYRSDDANEGLKLSFEGLENISKCLGDKDFFLGDKLSLPDLYIAELIALIKAFDTENTLAENYPNIDALHKRVDELPEIKAFLESDRCKDFKFNNKSAKLFPS
ncbi:unnamed protein product [Moneuplotes crassus]|uniref:glutathione transferase n=1 Tax=Euplotes crassus TaxID=5936 RepID=A0AAD1XTJ5_EUPCR|nr:unnamed protein product [Moneuplotes crassus]